MLPLLPRLLPLPLLLLWLAVMMLLLLLLWVAVMMLLPLLLPLVTHRQAMPNRRTAVMQLCPLSRRWQFHRRRCNHHQRLTPTLLRPRVTATVRSSTQDLQNQQLVLLCHQVGCRPRTNHHQIHHHDHEACN